MMPLGAIFPIASHLQGAYDLPARGQVSAEGWIRCDGSVIPAGNRVQGNAPDLTDGRFLRGITASGTTGGAETVTLAIANLPAHTHTARTTEQSIDTTGEASREQTGHVSHNHAHSGRTDNGNLTFRDDGYPDGHGDRRCHYYVIWQSRGGPHSNYPYSHGFSTGH